MTGKLGPYSLLSGLKVCLDAAKGMVYLHSADIIHRDLKSMNIMIADGMRGKVADYGESREETTTATMTHSAGTPLWMAPEIACATRYDSQADIFSFGIILYEVIKRDVPYTERTDLNGFNLALEVAIKGLRPTIEEDWHPGLKSLLRDCYEMMPSNRPTFSQLVLRLKGIIESMSGGEGVKVAEEQAATGIDTNFIGLGSRCDI